METRRGKYVDSSDRQKWNKIFNDIVHLIQTQQSQLESLLKERKLLKDKIKLQYDRWVSDVNLFKERTSQLKKNLAIHEQLRVLEAAKHEFMAFLKQKEVLLCKLKLEDADGELADFKDIFELFCQKCYEPKEDQNGQERRFKAMEGELRRLKAENEKLKKIDNPKLSALETERDFAWNQLRKMETDLTNELKGKRAELDSAKATIGEQLKKMEELQSANAEKDNMISALKSNIAQLESESTRKSEEISRLSMELELQKKSRSDTETPVLRRCTGGSKVSRVGIKSGGIVMTTTENKCIPSSQTLEKGSRKRRRAEPVVETPRLFSSTFKIPKLKG